MDSKLILITCLIKLGVSAAVASAVMRSRVFKDLLFRRRRNFRNEMHLVAFVVVPIALGVLVRIAVKNFYAADVSFEMTILMGLIGGRYAGLLGGGAVAFPAFMHEEWVALPFYLAVGFVSGVCRDAAHNPEDIWSFSPFVDLSLYRWLKRVILHPFRVDWQIMFFFVIVVMQLVRTQLGRLVPGRIFSLDSSRLLVELAIVATVLACVAVPLKVWNVTRIELKLQEQETLLLQARLDALHNQINPHFLFNTLNSISSLVRFQPETARELILKLSKILRALLSRHDAFVPLRDEIAFIDDYLGIEMVRFGDKLRFEKQLDEDTLDVIVPSMLLQPLIENSIKHGLAPRIEGGSIWLRARCEQDKLLIELEDNGIGMKGSAELEARSGADQQRTRIGMNNIAERLRVLYGEQGKMQVNPSANSGTLIRIELPIVHVSGNLKDSAAAMVYAIRSNPES
jgi:two-component system LytT family sensor kinase